MKKQNYLNHKRYYIPHHFIFLPLLISLFTVGIIRIFKDPVHQLEWMLFSICIFCLFYLAIMLRQHYALGNQDRIVRLEFRLRYFELFGKSSMPVEQQLDFSQIAALRFADNSEFTILLERALQDNLSANNIKKEIRNWQPDNDRL